MVREVSTSSRVRVAVAGVALCAGCGFIPGARVPDACALLSVAEAQALVATSEKASSWFSFHTPDDQSGQACRFTSAESVTVDLLVTIPLTPAGDEEVNGRITHGLAGEVGLTPIDSLGDAAATYLQPGTGQGIRAKGQGDLVDLFVWSSDGSVPVPNLVAAMRLVLSRLPPQRR